MKTSVTIGQIPTSWDIEKNLAMIDQVLTESGPDDVVLAPEGALSGYDRTCRRCATSTTRAADRELPGGGRRISRAEMRGRRRRRGVVWTAARIAAPFSATGHSRHRD